MKWLPSFCFRPISCTTCPKSLLTLQLTLCHNIFPVSFFSFLFFISLFHHLVPRVFHLRPFLIAPLLVSIKGSQQRSEPSNTTLLSLYSLTKSEVNPSLKSFTPQACRRCVRLSAARHAKPSSRSWREPWPQGYPHALRCGLDEVPCVPLHLPCHQMSCLVLSQISMRVVCTHRKVRQRCVQSPKGRSTYGLNVKHFKQVRARHCPSCQAHPHIRHSRPHILLKCVRLHLHRYLAHPRLNYGHPASFSVKNI